MRPSRRVTVARLAVLAVFLLGTTGVIYGYPALKPVMVDEGVYGRLCANMSASDANAQTPCTAQSLRLDLMFTVGAMAPTVGIANGFLVDRLGARLMVLAGAIGLALSAVLFAFSDDAGLDAFIPSYAGLGIFGQVIMQSSMTLSSLMPERSGLILSFYNTAFDASAVVFVVLDAVYRGSGAPSLRALFVGYAAVPALLALCVYVIVPSSEEFAQATRERTSSSMTLRLRKGDDQLAMEQGPARPQLTYKEVYLANALMEAPLKDQLRSPLLWLAVYCVSVYQMRLNFYMSTIDNQLRQLTDTATAEAMTSAFAIILPVAGVAIAAPVGWLLDSQRISTVQLIVFGSGVMFGVTMLVPNTALQYVSFLVVSAFRPMMYASFADFIGRIFGFTNFGVLWGVILCSASLVSLLAYPLNYWSLDVLQGNFVPANAVLFALVLPCAAFAVYMLRFERGGGAPGGLISTATRTGYSRLRNGLRRPPARAAVASNDSEPSAHELDDLDGTAL